MSGISTRIDVHMAAPGEDTIQSARMNRRYLDEVSLPRPSADVGDVDQYASDTHLCWYLHRPSDELKEAVGSGWLGPPGTVVDLGCGLGSELRYLAQLGWRGIGVDLSLTALARARGSSSSVFGCADVCQLPIRDEWANAVIDRGCFHYLQPDRRHVYVSEARRVLRPGGRLLLRACLPHVPSAGAVSEAALADLFREWRVESLRRRVIPVEYGTLEAIEGRFEK